MRSVVALLVCLVATPALAHHRHHHKFHRHVVRVHNLAEGLGHGLAHMLDSAGHNVAAARARGLPWCGAYMADVFHFVGEKARELWIAAAWAREGRPTSPHVGAVVVWRHHVGKIIGQQDGRWIVESGNDGRAVRARVRSLSGAIAFRDI